MDSDYDCDPQLAAVEKELTAPVSGLLEAMNRASTEVNTLERQLAEAQDRYKRLLDQWSQQYEELRATHGSSIDRVRPYFDAAQAFNGASRKVQAVVREFSAAASIHAQAKSDLKSIEDSLAYGAHKVNLNPDQQDSLSKATVYVLKCQQDRDRKEQEYARALGDFKDAQEAVESWRSQLGDSLIQATIPCFRELQKHQEVLATEQKRIHSLSDRAKQTKQVYHNSIRELDRINVAVHNARQEFREKKRATEQEQLRARQEQEELQKLQKQQQQEEQQEEPVRQEPKKQEQQEQQELREQQEPQQQQEQQEQRRYVDEDSHQSQHSTEIRVSQPTEPPASSSAFDSSGQRTSCHNNNSSSSNNDNDDNINNNNNNDGSSKSSGIRNSINSSAPGEQTAQPPHDDGGHAVALHEAKLQQAQSPLRPADDPQPGNEESSSGSNKNKTNSNHISTSGISSGSRVHDHAVPAQLHGDGRPEESGTDNNDNNDNNSSNSDNSDNSTRAISNGGPAQLHSDRRPEESESSVPAPDSEPSRQLGEAQNVEAIQTSGPGHVSFEETGEDGLLTEGLDTSEQAGDAEGPGVPGSSLTTSPSQSPASEVPATTSGLVAATLASAGSLDTTTASPAVPGPVTRLEAQAEADAEAIFPEALGEAGAGSGSEAATTTATAAVVAKAKTVAIVARAHRELSSSDCEEVEPEPELENW